MFFFSTFGATDRASSWESGSFFGRWCKHVLTQKEKSLIEKEREKVKIVDSEELELFATMLEDETMIKNGGSFPHAAAAPAAAAMAAAAVSAGPVS